MPSVCFVVAGRQASPSIQRHPARKGAFGRVERSPNVFETFSKTSTCSVTVVGQKPAWQAGCGW